MFVVQGATDDSRRMVYMPSIPIGFTIGLDIITAVSSTEDFRFRFLSAITVMSHERFVVQNHTRLAVCSTDDSCWQWAKTAQLRSSGPVLGESTGDQWIPHIKDQWYMMTSSWLCEVTGERCQPMTEMMWQGACKPMPQCSLTHLGRVTHICVGKLTIIGSDNGLSPERRQAIIWTNAGILLIRPLGTNSSEI